MTELKIGAMTFSELSLIQHDDQLGWVTLKQGENEVNIHYWYFKELIDTFKALERGSLAEIKQKAD